MNLKTHTGVWKFHTAVWTPVFMSIKGRIQNRLGGRLAETSQDSPPTPRGLRPGFQRALEDHDHANFKDVFMLTFSFIISMALYSSMRS